MVVFVAGKIKERTYAHSVMIYKIEKSSTKRQFLLISLLDCIHNYLQGSLWWIYQYIQSIHVGCSTL